MGPYFPIRQSAARPGSPGQRRPGAGDQDAAGDPSADALDGPQHHHVRGLPEPGMGSLMKFN